MDCKKLDSKWKFSDILGFEVFSQSGSRLGVVSGMILAGTNDIWVVKYCNEEVLIPAFKNIIREVNIARKKIFVELPKNYENIYNQIKSTDIIFEYNGYYTYEN
jgi:16S rRNA processing protein RimM